MLRPQPVEQRARRRFAEGRRHPPPALRHRRQPLVLGIGQPQPLPQTLGVLGDHHAERTEPARGVGGDADRRLDLGHVLEAREIADAAEHAQQQPGIGHRNEGRHRMRRHHQLQYLHAHAFARQLIEPVAAGNAGGDALGIRMIAGAVGGVETEEAQDAKVIFLDALLGIADETHAPRGQIGEPADIIVDRAVGCRRQGVDGEIAPLGVGLPVAAEGDLGVAAIGLHILAQRGHLERMLVDNDGDGAVLDAGRHRLEAGGRDALDHFLRHRRGGDVDLMDGQIEQRIAHRAADYARFLAVAVEHAEQARQRAAREPGRAGKTAGGRASRRRHLVVPGTNLPSSICAGT